MSNQQLIQAIYPYRQGRVVASTTALAAVPFEELVDDTLWIVDGSSALQIYLYKLGTAPTLAPGVVPCTAGGYFIQVAAAGQPNSVRVHLATAAALDANTRTGNVLYKDAPAGALTIDGHGAAAGDLVLVKDEVAGQNNGIYVVDDAGGATRWQMTRAVGFDTSAEMTPGLLVHTERGAVNDNVYFTLTTDAPITLNTTPLVFTAIPVALGATGAMTGETPDAANNAGVGVTAAPIDHVHAAPCAAPVDQPTTTAALAEGNAATFARSNHLHTITLTSGNLGARPAAALAGLTYRQTDNAPGLYRDTGAAWERIAAQIDFVTATITSDDLVAAGVGPESVNIGAALPAGAVILGYGINLTDAFDNGAGVSLAMEVGYNGHVDAIEDGFNCFTGSPLEAAGWTFVTRGPGIGAPCIVGSTRQCLATFTAGADQLANFTNGSVTIRIYYIQL